MPDTHSKAMYHRVLFLTVVAINSIVTLRGSETNIKVKLLLQGFQPSRNRARI